MEPNWRFAKRVPHPSPSSIFSQAPRMQENARNTNKSRLNSMEFRARLEGPGEGGEESTITRNYLRPGRPSDLEISSRERSAPGRAGQRPGRTRQDIHGVLNHPPLHELLGAQDLKAERAPRDRHCSLLLRCLTLLLSVSVHRYLCKILDACCCLLLFAALEVRVLVQC